MENRVFAGRFTVLRSLGWGGMSEVLLAKDSTLGEDVALKLIHPQHVRNRTILERFKQEVSISRKIRHPGIIRIFDLFTAPDGDPDIVFLSMEYLPGGNLKTRIQMHEALPVKECVAIGIEALSALEAAHEAGIIHRDIKPHNLLFTSDGHIRITDFGLARSCTGSDVFTDTTTAGTPEYCSPEVALGEYADSRSDLYSLGVTLYESLTGRLPFTAATPYLVLKQQADAPAPSLRELRSDIPEEINRIILKALEKDPSERFQTAREFREALENERLETVIPVPHDYTCPVCGEPLYSTLPYCFQCGETILDVNPVRRKKDGYRVVVLGTGKPGDKIAAEDRSRILALIGREALNSRSLEKKIPRIPFVLLNELEKSSAEILAARLTTMGIPAIASGKGKKLENKKAALLTARKVFALAPRIWLILFASGTGMFNSIFRVGSDGLTPILPLAFTVMFGIVPVVVAVQTLLPGTKFRKGQRKEANPFRDRFLQAASRLTSPVLQGIARSAGRKLDSILALASVGAIGNEREREDFLSDLSRTASRWCDLLERIQGMESLLKSDSDAAYERELERLEQAFIQSETFQDGNRAELDRSRIRSLLADRRELEHLRDRSFDTLLKFTSGLDRLALSTEKAARGDAEREITLISDELEYTQSLQSAFPEPEEEA